MQRWWNETGRYPTVEERLNHIENIWPNLLRDVYRLEIQAGGQGQLPLIGGIAFEAYGKRRKDRVDPVFLRGA